MRKIKLLFVTLLSMMAWTGVMADEIDDANAAITNDAAYRIYTLFDGSSTGTTKYYLKANGYLTDQKSDAKLFTFTRASGGSYAAGKGYKLNQFTNGGDGSNNITSEAQKHIIVSANNNRDDFEGQVFFLNSDGDYAIRSTNANSSGWAASAFWTVVTDNDADGLPNATYTMNGAQYIWKLEGPITTINVTYKLMDGTTEVSSTTVQQESNSAIASPLPGTGMDYNGNFHEKFYYDYAVSGTIGDKDCTITITRTEKAGLVKALTGLSNNKAYYIGCDRGAMIAYDGKMVNTALNNATVNAQPLGKFALLNYEDNYYIFSVDENKFVKNDASVALDLTTAGFSTEDAIVMEAKTAPYFLWHFKAEGKYLNTNGNQPLGYVINSWSQADEGNQYYMVEAGDFDPTAALAELDAYFNPAYFVTYVVKDEFGNTIFTSDSQPAKAGAKITTLLDEFKKPFYTYSDNNVEITEQNTTVEFTATWNGPFKLSADFDNAQWQNMAMRGTWYVTSGVKDGDGAYQTQNANTMGLVEDAYQWAFIGNGYDGFKIINKAEGNGKSFGWTDAQQTNAGIPTIMDDSEGHHAWKIVASTNTSVPANSFCLNVPGTNLYINQFGGAGGSVKFWDSTGNVGDAGSAFTVFDVPTNFASFVVDEIAPYFESTAKYFVFTDAAKAEIGYDESYKTDCSFAQYKSMKDKLTAEFIGNLSNYVLPETGYYRIKSAYYDGRYITYNEVNGVPYIGTAVNPDEAITNVVKLTALGNNKYTITVGGLSATSPAQSQLVGLEKTGAELTAVITAPGVGTFTNGEQHGALHCAASSTPAYYVVGWTSDAAASQWILEDANVNKIQAGITSVGLATLNALWPVTIPTGVKAYVGKILNNKYLVMTEVTGTIPAATPVVLEGEEGTYTFNFADDVETVENDLKGTYAPLEYTDDTPLYYVLNVLPTNAEIGFYALNGTLAANRAYLEIQGGAATVKGITLSWGNPTGIETVKTAQAGKTIYNLAGQRVLNAQKGIYIVDGKKAVVK